MLEDHCKDCCCARSWKALGVESYTGKSIPEHIAEDKNRIAVLEKALRFYADGSYAEGGGVYYGRSEIDFGQVARQALNNSGETNE